MTISIKMASMTLLLAFIATVATYLIVRERTHESDIDGCITIGTSDHGFPLPYYKKVNENFSTFESIYSRNYTQKCLSYIKQVIYPSIKAINAIADFVIWIIAIIIIYSLWLYLANSLKGPLSFSKGPAIIVTSLIVGVALSALSYQISRSVSSKNDGPCPILYTEKRGLPLAYHESYSADCILEVGFFQPDKIYVSKFLEDFAFWAALSSISTSSILMLRRQKS